MSTERQARKKKGIAQTCELISWKQKKIIADKEEEEIGKEVQELIKWTSLIESMNDQQLREYLRNRPENMQCVKIPKPAPGKKVQRIIRKPKASNNNGLMGAIWKFHREDEEIVQIPH